MVLTISGKMESKPEIEKSLKDILPSPFDRIKKIIEEKQARVKAKQQMIKEIAMMLFFFLFLE